MMSNLVDLAVFPGPLEHIIGAKGIAFGEATGFVFKPQDDR